MRPHLRSIGTAVLLLAALCVFVLIPQKGEALPAAAVEIAGTVAGMPPASRAENDVLTAVPPNAFNPDAGLGLARGANYCKSGYAAYNIENESATPVYVCWRRGTTKANYTSVCRKRCSGCAGGISAVGEVSDSASQLYVIAGVATDAGVQVSIECAQ